MSSHGTRIRTLIYHRASDRLFEMWFEKHDWTKDDTLKNLKDSLYINVTGIAKFEQQLIHQKREATKAKLESPNWNAPKHEE